MIIEWVLPADLTAARAAREHVATELGRRDLADDIVHDAVLVSSELAANAIRHGRPPVVLRLDFRADSMRISVHDHGEAANPEPASAATTQGHGRGLAIVDELSIDTGWERDASGTTVWADLALR